MRRALCWATLVALTLATPAAAQDARDFFKVGVVAELSGDLATGGNVTQAARKLKISRKSLQTKMKELGLRG